MSNPIDRIRELAERYLRDDIDGDLDAEKWGLAMPPGDVLWMAEEIDRLRRDRDSYANSDFERQLSEAREDLDKCMECQCSYHTTLRKNKELEA